MTVDEWKDLSQKIIESASDLPMLTSLLNQCNQGFADEVAARMAAEEARDKLTADNESLRDANMKFFLELSQRATERATGPEEVPKEKGPEDIHIEDLFKEDK